MHRYPPLPQRCQAHLSVCESGSGCQDGGAAGISYPCGREIPHCQVHRSNLPYKYPAFAARRQNWQAQLLHNYPASASDSSDDQELSLIVVVLTSLAGRNNGIIPGCMLQTAAIAALNRSRPELFSIARR
jgi:hypothetical protein